MDITDLIELAESANKKSNKDLMEGATLLTKEFEDTKALILQLSHHLDNVEKYYYLISEEIKERQNGVNE